MKFGPLIRTLVVSALVGGVLLAAFFTRESWLPHVFPSGSSKTEAKGGHGHGHGHDHGAPADRIKLSPLAQQNLGLDADTLTPREYWRKILIPGVVVDRPGESDRGVPSRATGIVTEINAKPGDTVKPGALLFKLDLVSEFLQSTQIELAKSATDLAFNITERDRVANLVKLGTAPAADLTRLQNQVDRLTTLVKSLRRQLQLFGFDAKQVDRAEAGEVVTEVTVAAPPSGATDTLYEVKDLKVRLGEQVQAGQTLCTLADHRRLFVEGWAFKTEAKALADAAEKRVRVHVEFADEEPGSWPPVEPLVIRHLANQVDPVNRTFPFYLPLDNQARPFTRDQRTFLAWRFRPGQRVRLRVPVEKLFTRGPDGKEVNPFVLPAGAVVREGPEAFVFVQAGDLFIRKPVRVLYEDSAEVVIANDGSVTRAEIVVKNQAAAINRALKAAAAGPAGHSHDH
jgi:multidrug efflux pump subunit AcrA (membrane-fusion protein)